MTGADHASFLQPADVIFPLTCSLGQRPGGLKQLFYSFNLDDHVPSDHLLRKYAHLASDHLVQYVDRMSGLRLLQDGDPLRCSQNLAPPSSTAECPHVARRNLRLFFTVFLLRVPKKSLSSPHCH
jgi:hypothetical protein